MVKIYLTLMHFGMPLRQERALQRMSLLMRLRSYNLRTCSIRYGLQRIDGVVTPRCYHTTREQGVLIGRASCKLHAYMRLGYLA